MQQLIVRDQVHGRPPTDTFNMPWQDSVPLTPRMLIAERVRLEWETQEQERQAERDRKASGNSMSAPLVDGAMMQRMNPYRFGIRSGGTVTLKSVTDLAIEGFGRNAFFLIVDGRQIADLDEVIPFKPTSDVTFVRLIPLKGG
jgi:hypothetical protein